jgi:predicted nucleotide-binding protein
MGSLPIRTVVEDVKEVAAYLYRKPTGATLADAKKVLDSKYLDGRKLSALKFWGILEEDEGKLKLTAEGRLAAKEQGVGLPGALTRAIRRIEPYRAIIERAGHRKESSVSATEAAVHWHEHFPDEASENDKILNDQAVCFFQIAEGAGLGQVVVGRRGSPTRFEFNAQALAAFVDRDRDDGDTASPPHEELEPANIVETRVLSAPKPTLPSNNTPKELGQGIFIAHGRNKKPLEQLKKILDQFKVPYRVAVEEPNLGRPISSKVRETMEACNCAVLIFTADEEFRDTAGSEIWRPSENVIYELGASGYLYGNRIVIMKESGVQFPSNFRDLGYISFDKDQLEAKAMDILKELIGFGIVKVST